MVAVMEINREFLKKVPKPTFAKPFQPFT